MPGARQRSIPQHAGCKRTGGVNGQTDDAIVQFQRYFHSILHFIRSSILYSFAQASHCCFVAKGQQSKTQEICTGTLAVAVQALIPLDKRKSEGSRTTQETLL